MDYEKELYDRDQKITLLRMELLMTQKRMLKDQLLLIDHEINSLKQSNPDKE